MLIVLRVSGKQCFFAWLVRLLPSAFFLPVKNFLVFLFPFYGSVVEVGWFWKCRVQLLVHIDCHPFAVLKLRWFLLAAVFFFDLKLWVLALMVLKVQHKILIPTSGVFCLFVCFADHHAFSPCVVWCVRWLITLFGRAWSDLETALTVYGSRYEIERWKGEAAFPWR